ncbi:hypothetical protein PTTG_29268 [Puccinia triticina 1-1 BBBD Race 1]|uniref:Uncharacterized protein n=1 Tax=Puccinia triticina (isolate 1-1 / race 1 (BBBD)) TaxID=630390 RepID=A0A180G5D0_PUCT1|nr:hypothetical protein PTTG_29268 [Puccinia triticina 1-1 BBBD Race 1]
MTAPSGLVRKNSNRWDCEDSSSERAHKRQRGFGLKPNSTREQATSSIDAEQTQITHDNQPSSTNGHKAHPGQIGSSLRGRITPALTGEHSASSSLSQRIART